MDQLGEFWQEIILLGEEHNVNPIMFAVLYLVSIPPYLFSIAWVVRNFRKGASVVFPIISTLVFFVLPSMYIAVFGRNVAWWVYAIIALLLIYGGFSAVRSVRKKISGSI